MTGIKSFFSKPAAAGSVPTVPNHNPLSQQPQLAPPTKILPNTNALNKGRPGRIICRPPPPPRPRGLNSNPLQKKPNNLLPPKPQKPPLI